jgi:hypothetical protein
MARADAAPMSSSNPLLALLSDPPGLGKRRQSRANMLLLAKGLTGGVILSPMTLYPGISTSHFVID